MTSREPKSDPKAPPRLPYPATTDWPRPPVTFTNSRQLKPINRFREDLYLCRRAQYTADGLRARWERWLADRKAVKSAASGRNGWETRSKSTNGTSILTTPTIRPFTGLRGTGILARAEQG